MSFPGEALIGHAISGGLNYAGTLRTNEANRAMAREQMGFQERMSNTAYQRMVADIDAAGLNVNLAYGGGGAASPSGSTSQMQNEFAGVASSAKEAAMQEAQMANMREQNKLIQAQVVDTNSAARLKEALGFGAKVTAAATGATALGRAVGGASKLWPFIQRMLTGVKF